MDSIYIETSIVSHATAWPSSDIQIAAMQYQARTWWADKRTNYDLVASQLVLKEAGAGDPVAAVERLKLLQDVAMIPIDDEVRALARELVSASIMPQQASADALHVAAAAVGGIQYLLSLNCRHIANAHELPRVYRLLDDRGYGQLLICTPSEFLGNEPNDGDPD